MYVDDNKIIHKNPKVVDDIIAAIGKMTVCRGKKHVFVGMDIEFLEDQTLLWALMMRFVRSVLKIVKT